MNTLNKITTAVAVALSLGLAATAYAHPMGGNMGTGAQQGTDQMPHGMKQGSHHGTKHDGKHAARGKGCDAAGGQHGAQAGQSLLTPEEHTAFRDKMRNAKSPEERQQIALANRAEMEKRAAEKGVKLPEHREHRGHRGPNAAPATQTN